MRAVFRWIGIALALLAVAIVVLVLVFDWNWVKDYVAGKASDALGQTVTITGDIDVDLALKPNVRVEGIRIDNADWSPESHMLELPLLAFQIDLLKLLQGRLVFPEIELSKPTVRLERSEKEQLNWTKLDPSAGEEQQPENGEREGANLPRLDHLLLREGRFIYHDYASREEVTSTITELTATTTGAEQTLEVKGAGQFADQPLQLTLHTGSLAAFETKTSVPLRGQLTVGEMRARVEGTVTQPLQLAGADLDVSLQGAPPEALFTVLNLPGSPPQPLRLQGHLSHEDTKWTLQELTATLGKSDIAGTATLNRTGERPFARADLASTTLDIPALAAMVQGQQSQQATTDTDNQGEIPEISFEPERLRRLDAKLTFQGENVIVANQTLHNVSVEGQLQDGHLILQPAFALTGGTVDAKLEVKGGDTPVQSALEATIKQIDLAPALTTMFGVDLGLTGTVAGEVGLSGTGHSLERLIQSADGRATVTLQDADLDTDVSLAVIAGRDTAQDTAQHWQLTGEGRVWALPFNLDGQVGPVQTLRQDTKPTPAQVTVSLGEARLELDGALPQLSSLDGLDVQLALQGPLPDKLASRLPDMVQQLPDDYQLEGHLRHQARTWRLEDLQASVGDSDVAGTLALDTGGKRPALQGDLRSNRLDITALTGGTSSHSASNNAENTPAQDQVMPDFAIDPASLHKTDADVNFTGDQVVAAGLTWQDVEADLTLRDGHLVLAPRAELIGGTIRAELEVESTPTPMQSSIHANIERVNLKDVLAIFDLPKEAFGAVNGVIDLAGTGHTLASFLDTADGDVVVTMNGGRLDQLLLELAGLDLGEAIVSAFTGTDQTVPLRCVAIDFNVQDGKMQARTLVISTTDSKIVGDGFIDLGEERVDLTLKLEAKDFSAFSADAPIHIQGPFSNLSLSTNIGQALLSLATPVETSEAESVNCQALFERARRDTPATKP